MPFAFHFYSVLLLIGFLQGVAYAVLSIIRGFREDKPSDKLLGILLLLISFHIAQYMLGFAGWYNNENGVAKGGYSTFMFYFPFHNVLWIGPIFYFYFRSLTNDKFTIAYECGFNSKATFNRSFKKFMGMSPQEFTQG